MQFYTKQHKFYCGIDLHAKKMYVCILDEKGEVREHRNIRTDRDVFLAIIAPFREDVVVAVECMFTWYWIADLCQKEAIPFVLGHALYMKAIHGGKAKNDKIDSKKLEEPFGCIAKPYQRGDIVGAFDHPAVKKSMEVNLKVIETYDVLLLDLEKTILKLANQHDPVAYALLDSIYGIGKIGALTILYEIEDIRRFPRVQDFVSYARLVKCAHESNGKKYGTSGAKIGNAHLKWAFSEAAALFLRGNEPGKLWFERLVHKHGKGKALSILAHKLGRATYFMLKNKEAFDMQKFLR